MHVYVIVWLAVVFGINSVSNAGKKIVIVRGAAKHYYTFHTCIVSISNPNTTADCAVTDQSKIVVIIIAVDKMDGRGLRNIMSHKCLLKKTGYMLFYLFILW